MTGRTRVVPFEVAVLSVAALALVGCSCRNRAKEDLALFRAAEARYLEGRRLLGEGKLRESSRANREAQQLLFDMRARLAPLGDGEEPQDGDPVAGFSPRQWQERFQKEYLDAVRQQYGTMVEMAGRGTLDRDEARTFLLDYDPALARRWVGADEAGGPGAPELYYVDCVMAESAHCAGIFEAVSRRLVRPTTMDKPRAGAAVWGTIKVRGGTRAWAEVTGARLTVFNLPRSLEVTLEVATQGGSSWDGVKRLSVIADPPTQVPEAELPAAYRAQVELLRQKMVREIAAIPVQNLGR